MKTLGEGIDHETFVVEMTKYEYHALEQLQRIAEGRFSSTSLRGLGADMTASILAVVAFVQVQDVIGNLEAGVARLREALK